MNLINMYSTPRYQSNFKIHLRYISFNTTQYIPHKNHEPFHSAPQPSVMGCLKSFEQTCLKSSDS